MFCFNHGEKRWRGTVRAGLCSPLQGGFSQNMLGKTKVSEGGREGKREDGTDQASKFFSRFDNRKHRGCWRKEN